MGNNSKPPVVERKRKKKKKGRPSLLEIQKRSLRLQQQDQLKQNPNPNPNSTPPSNPYTRHQSPSSGSGRRVTRRNPNPDPSPSGDASAAASSSDEDGGGSSGRRREKKLKHVLRLPNSDTDPDPKDEGNKSEKGTDSQQEEALQVGPTTALPDKKTLEFILDRLQKKDTYGVYSEPVDPEELPDYHDIIEHPMDFSTVRKKLSGGAYRSLEQFEKDVLLISSNAMKYNAPDTVYFRQARTIQELAKKSFENLRQGGGDVITEQELPPPKPAVRRGRPPNKNKKPAVKPSSDDIAPDVKFDVPKPTNSSVPENHNQWSLTYDITKKASSVLEKPAIFNHFSWLNEQRAERKEELSGSGLKGLSAKYGKKPSDENRRKTYKLSQLSTSSDEFPILSTFDRERKLLVPVGIQVEHAYARSVARYAAKLGPVGWAIAAKKIERVLPPGTKFGPGWVIDGEPTKNPKQHISSPPPHNTPHQTQPNAPSPAEVEKFTKREDNSRSGTSGTTSDSADGNKISSTMFPRIENNFSEALYRPTINGFSTPQNHTMQNLAKAVVPHGQAFSMIHRSNNYNSGVINQRHMLNLAAKSDSVAPDLNVGFQQLGSPRSSNSGSRVDSQQQPDLALQL